jgi:hypothetical protein
LRVLGDRVAAGIDRRVGSRAQISVSRDFVLVRLNRAGNKVEVAENGVPSGAVDDAIGLNRALDTALFIDDAEAVPCLLDLPYLDPRADRHSDPLGLSLQVRHRICIHVSEQQRQRLEDRNLDAGAGIDVAELECDHAAADKDDARRQTAIAQHIVGGNHQLGTGKRQPPRPRPGGDHDVLRLQGFAADNDGVRAGKAAAFADHLDAAPVHQLRERGWDARDHRLLAVDQCGPIEARLADRDVVRFGALDLVERMRGGDQHFFRHAAAVGAGFAEQIRLQHRDLAARLSSCHGRTHPGVASAEDHDVEAACWRLRPP